MRLPYRSAFDGPSRVRVTPDAPGGFPERAPRTRRPHGDAKVAAVRALIEQTTLTYSEIEARTGVGRASICRWTRDQNWQRPVFAPRATDTVPRERASARLKRRTLASRLDALAERYVRELEADPGVDLDKLAAALELAKMAKLAARPKKRRRALSPPVVPAQQRGARPAQDAGTRGQQSHESAADILKRLRAEGVRLDRAPEAAVRDVIDSHRPPEDNRHTRPRGRRSRRNREHGRMFDWGR
ncbi:MAG TPA: hypothetical protein VNZ93_19285 [Pseudorhodoplanes sp.]|nr:hypothetical protein [Pseudorhodoplanes sp.]